MFKYNVHFINIFRCSNVCLLNSTMMDSTNSNDTNETILFHLKLIEFITNFYKEMYTLDIKENNQLGLLAVFYYF